MIESSSKFILYQYNIKNKVRWINRIIILILDEKQFNDLIWLSKFLIFNSLL